MSKLYTKRWNEKQNKTQKKIPPTLLNRKTKTEIMRLDARNGFLMEDSTLKENKDSASCWRIAFLQQPPSVSVLFNTEMYKGTNDTLTLWANRSWVKDTNNSVNYFFFSRLFYWARIFLFFEQQKCNQKKKISNSLPMSINSSTHFIFVITDIKIRFFFSSLFLHGLSHQIE